MRAEDLLHPDDRWPHRHPPRDYVAQPYPPAADPAGRLASAAVLRHVLRGWGLLDAAWPIVQALSDVAGPGRTVWGVKVDRAGHPGLELYFYNEGFNPPGNPLSVTRLARALDGLLQVEGRLDERRRYLMCSLDLAPEVLAAGRSPGFRIYVPGRRDRTGWDGLSFLAGPDGLVRENAYCFYRAEDELEAVREQLRASARCPGDGAAVFWEDLLPCHAICFAHKAHADALYVSRADTAAVARRLAGWLPEAAALLQADGGPFDHLRWDVGWDFATPPEDADAVAVLRVGLYGTV